MELVLLAGLLGTAVVVALTVFGPSNGGQFRGGVCDDVPITDPCPRIVVK